MARRTTTGSAISAVVLASILAGCAAPTSTGAQAGKLTAAKIPYATRALSAFAANDIANAVTYGEQAVEANPEDGGVRALLGTMYFAAGRFASAESAYKDALALKTSDPKVVLKLALVQVALGKNQEALNLLTWARNALDSADYGLALALAGRPADAVAVLEPAARMRGADARVRQNLALSYALAGDWNAARIVAAQDVPADQLDARIDQWLKLSTPARPSDQVAALTGVNPVLSDPGQPVRLALKGSNTALAAVQSAPAPAPVATPVPAPVAAPVEVAQAEPLPAYTPPSRAEEPAPPPFKLEPVDVAQEPFVEIAPPPPPARAVAKAAPKKSKPSVRAASFVPKRTPVRPTIATGKSAAVVQIGAYGSPQRVAEAWNAAARRYAALRNYMPVSARFQSPQGPVYRLSVKGFASADQAKNLCITLRRSGGTCFVRNVAGDAPVRIASR